jgi:hypothetical protein
VLSFTGDGNSASWLRTLQRELGDPARFDQRGQSEAANEPEMLEEGIEVRKALNAGFIPKRVAKQCRDHREAAQQRGAQGCGKSTREQDQGRASELRGNGGGGEQGRMRQADMRLLGDRATLSVRRIVMPSPTSRPSLMNGPEMKIWSSWAVM